MSILTNILKRLRRSLRFSLWYFRSPPWDTGISPPELLSFIQSHPPGKALDLGCGTGTNLLTLARAGWEVAGIDIALPAVLAARRKLARFGPDRARVRLGDVTRLDWARGPFDLILDIGCYHGLTGPERLAYRRNLHRLLAPGGAFLLYAHRKPEGEPGHGVSEADIRSLSADLALHHRLDSRDRIDRPASWLTYRKSSRP